jgi:hypothetical protein
MGSDDLIIMEKNGYITPNNALSGRPDLMLRKKLPQFGVRIAFVDGGDTDVVSSPLRPNTGCSARGVH